MVQRECKGRAAWFGFIFGKITAEFASLSCDWCVCSSYPGYHPIVPVGLPVRAVAAMNGELVYYQAIAEKRPFRRGLLVYAADQTRPPRIVDGIEIVPVQGFLRRLWAGELDP